MILYKFYAWTREIYFENLMGSAFNDVLAGSSVGNILYGGLGNDSLDGGLANDTLYGGAGNDKYIYSSGSGKGNDIIEDESGSADQISFGSAYTAANTSLARFGQYDLALVSGGQNLFYIKNQFTLDGSIESVKWGDGSILNLLTYSHTLNGTTAGETLYGTSYGAAGDVINALGGDDTVYAGAGNDVVSGGDDTDTIEGGLGDDTLDGGFGTDTVSYASATLAVSVNLALATAQNTGGAGTDLLSNFENIMGSAFGDILTGNASANTLTGAAGADTITGGLGADAFKFVLGSLDGTSDHITDYSTAQGDKIDLKDLLIGYDPITKLITDFVEFTDSGANTLMKVDKDGTGTAYGWQQVGFLDNVTGLTDEAALKASGNLIVV